jgi:hypothetical protein
MKDALSSSQTSILTRVTGLTSQETAFFITALVLRLCSPVHEASAVAVASQSNWRRVGITESAFDLLGF